MKRITLIAFTALTCCSLAGCGGQNSKQAKQASEASSLKAANAKLKKKISKKKHHQNKPASSSAVSSSTKQSNQQATQSSNNQQKPSSPQGVNNADQAVAAARAKYGDQNGYIHWGYMIDGDTGQPSRFDDGSYFVKGTANDGTMTGTQYSLRVYPDGSIVSN